MVIPKSDLYQGVKSAGIFTSLTAASLNISTLGVFIYLGSNFPEFEPKSMAFCDGRLCWLVDTNQWWTNYPSPQTEPEIDSENMFVLLNSVLNINSPPEQYDCYFLFLAQQWLHMLSYCQCHALALPLRDCGSLPPILTTNSMYPAMLSQQKDKGFD